MAGSTAMPPIRATFISTISRSANDFVKARGRVVNRFCEFANSRRLFPGLLACSLLTTFAATAFSAEVALKETGDRAILSNGILTATISKSKARIESPALPRFRDASRRLLQHGRRARLSHPRELPIHRQNEDARSDRHWHAARLARRAAGVDCAGEPRILQRRANQARPHRRVGNQSHSLRHESLQRLDDPRRGGPGRAENVRAVSAVLQSRSAGSERVLGRRPPPRRDRASRVAVRMAHRQQRLSAGRRAGAAAGRLVVRDPLKPELAGRGAWVGLCSRRRGAIGNSSRSTTSIGRRPTSKVGFRFRTSGREVTRSTPSRSARSVNWLGPM